MAPSALSALDTYNPNSKKTPPPTARNPRLIRSETPIATSNVPQKLSKSRIKDYDIFNTMSKSKPTTPVIIQPPRTTQLKRSVTPPSKTKTAVSAYDTYKRKVGKGRRRSRKNGRRSSLRKNRKSR
jgi:hypothetical protein